MAGSKQETFLIIFPGALSPGIFLHHHLTDLIKHLQPISWSLEDLIFITIRVA
jgi:hypothetical protein